MWARAEERRRALPPSQVVRTTPRGGSPGAAPAITAANVPNIAATPAAADTITVSGGHHQRAELSARVAVRRLPDKVEFNGRPTRAAVLLVARIRCRR